MLDEPFRGDADLARLRPLEPEADEPYVLETVRLLAKELEVPLIGFAGAPFTLASYLIEGGPSRDYARTKALLWSEPAVWDRLLTRARGHRRAAPARAGRGGGERRCRCSTRGSGRSRPTPTGHAVQPHMRRLFDGIADLGVPTIHFGVGTGELLGAMAEAGGDAIGIDARVPLDAGWDRVGGPGARAVQGNLDPTVLLSTWEAVEAQALDVLRARRRPRRARVQPRARRAADHAGRAPAAAGRPGARAHGTMRRAGSR